MRRTRRRVGAALGALAVTTACATPPRHWLGTSGYDVRLPEPPDEGAHAFGRRLAALDARLRRAYAVDPPRGEVWIDPRAFRGEAVGGTYEWSSDRIILVERDEGYLAHELVHRYDRHAFGQLPRWLDEGLAYAFSRAGLDVCDPRPDFDTIAEVRDARARGPLPSMARVLDDPYGGGGHLHLRIATAVVDKLIRERRGDIASVVTTARALDPEAARAVLDRAAFGSFPDDEELRALLAEERAPDELVLGLAPQVLDDLARSCRVATADARARRRLCLLLEGANAGGPAAPDWLRARLDDEDPRVVRAAVYALAARGDRRALAPLIEVLKDAPLLRFVRTYPGGGATSQAVPVHHALARLAGETPPGVVVDEQPEAQPLPYRWIEAWEAWWRAHRAAFPEQYRVRTAE